LRRLARRSPGHFAPHGAIAPVLERSKAGFDRRAAMLRVGPAPEQIVIDAGELHERGMLGEIIAELLNRRI